MTENTFKSQLLKQNGKSALDHEVSRLHDLIDSERRRVRRLTWWTIGVWVLWFGMISVGLIVPYALAHANVPPATAATQPTTPPPPAGHRADGTSLFGAIIGGIILAAFLGLPVAGIILAIMLIVTRRTASMNQVRASLAAIDAQLRMLGAPGQVGLNSKTG